MPNQYFATVARGLEKVAAEELRKLNAKNIEITFAGVHFQGDKSLLYRVNIWSRTVFRFLMPILTIKCNDELELYNNVDKIDWSQYLGTEQTFAVNCTGKNLKLNHTHFTALQIKNSIVDQQRLRFNKRSIIDTKNPNILINAHIDKNSCILSLDSSGNSLHRRGYRTAMGFAPIKESLASAPLDIAEWTPDICLLDPMCGSGTIPIEATLKSLNIAVGLNRKSFGFQFWQDFDEKLYKTIINEAVEKQRKKLKAPIFGYDCDLSVIEQAKINAKQCNIEKHICFIQTVLKDIEAPADRGMIICNPPYGKRIGDTKELGKLYKLLGDILKQRFKGWVAYILSGDKELIKQIGLRASSRTSIYNGSLNCTLLKYDLY